MGGGQDLEGAVDAVEYTRRSLGKSLRAAREAAGLTQAELASKLGKAQPMISGAESGTVRVGERHVAAVLKACGLPKDWKPSKGSTRARRREACDEGPRTAACRAGTIAPLDWRP